MVHWQLEWRVPIEMKYVNFANKILRTFFNDNKSNINTIDRATRHEVDYLLKNIITINATENAVFYTDDSMVKVGYSYYSIVFSMPRSCIIHDDTKELGVPTDIIINEWAYENCYLKSINHILENWGKMVYGLLQCDENEPMVKYGTYKELIERIIIRRGLKEYNENASKNNKKRNNDLVHEENVSVGIETTEISGADPNGLSNIENLNNKNIEAEPIHSPNDSKDLGELYTFYTDGAGNLYGTKKTSPSGHYSILLNNTNEKWKHQDPIITSNIAEIKGVLAAILISIKRGYKNVEIKTDSQGVVKWVNGMDLHIKTNINQIWKAKNENIRYYIESLVSYGKKIPHLKLTWIKRDLNKAHVI